MAEAPPRLKSSDRPAPWLTLCLVALAGGCALWPELRSTAIYDREAILRGEIWRLATGHLVHFGGTHFVWNAAVMLVVGCWLESLAPRLARGFLLSAPVIVGAALLALDPELKIYAGLSGVATGAVTLLALILVQGSRGDRSIGIVSLALVSIKTITEFAGGTPWFAQFSDASIRPVPLAHLAGIVWACVFASIIHRREGASSTDRGQ